MKILVIGDVTSKVGVMHLERELWRFREREHIDLCIVNAENSGFITGPTPELADRLLDAGADCLTGGNHTLRNKAIYSYLDDSTRAIRPINFGASAPGSGYTVLNVNGYRVLIINAMGNIHIEPTLDSPFDYVERALEREAGRYDLAILDIHAEATGEKLAIAHAFDGRINVIFGPHTHVQTADEQILPGGTGYIILGMDVATVVKRMRTHLPIPFTPSAGYPRANGCIFDYDTSKKVVKSVKRVSF